MLAVIRLYTQRALGVVAPVLILLLLTRFFLLDFGQVAGQSMEPLLHDGQFFLVTKFLYLWHPPARGDVVQLFAPPGHKKLVLKRIIGLPGETVVFTESGVTIRTANGTLMHLDEPYVRWNITEVEPRPTPVTTGPFTYVVMGDNRRHSIDSRTYGAVHRRFITGRVRPLPWPD